MKTRAFFYMALSLLFCVLLFPAAVTASGTYPLDGMDGVIPSERLLPRLVDNADLLTDEEEITLLAVLDRISEEHLVDVAIVTVPELPDSYTAMAYADDLYDYYGFGYGDTRDGTLLLVSMGTRDWHMTTTGLAIDIFTDSDINYLSSYFLPDLSAGNYADSFQIFAELCEAEIIDWERYGGTSGHSEDYYSNAPVRPFSSLRIFAALVVGFLLALIPVSIMKGQLNTVRPKHGASDYVKPNSLEITAAHDRFLRRNVIRAAKPKENKSSTHRSSSGSRHGGGGGKF